MVVRRFGLSRRVRKVQRGGALRLRLGSWSREDGGGKRERDSTLPSARMFKGRQLGARRNSSHAARVHVRAGVQARQQLRRFDSSHHASRYGSWERDRTATTRRGTKTALPHPRPPRSARTSRRAGSWPWDAPFLSFQCIYRQRNDSSQWNNSSQRERSYDRSLDPHRTGWLDVRAARTRHAAGSHKDSNVPVCARGEEGSARWVLEADVGRQWCVPISLEPA